MDEVDTDVNVIIVGKLICFSNTDIWLAFGTGTKFRHIHVNTMCNVLGIEKSIALHSFTGCDTTSTFFGKGKKVSMGA